MLGASRDAMVSYLNWLVDWLVVPWNATHSDCKICLDENRVFRNAGSTKIGLGETPDRSFPLLVYRHLLYFNEKHAYSTMTSHERILGAILGLSPTPSKTSRKLTSGSILSGAQKRPPFTSEPPTSQPPTANLASAGIA